MNIGKAKETPPPRTVLVGTYKGDQLEKWPGWYCWPIETLKVEGSKVEGSANGKDAQRENPAQSPQSAQREFGSKENLCTSASLRKEKTSRTSRTSREEIPSGLQSVTELWLFQGTKAQRSYKAEFVGVKTRAELVRDYGYPATGKPHGDRYALFKTELLYRHKNEPQEEADAVIVRTKDFAKRSPKIAAQLKAYLESPDRNDPDLAKLLPSIVTQVPPERLRVCEAAVQLDFMGLMGLRSDPFEAKEKASRLGKLTCLDFFAGSGLVSAAMAKQFETVWANDISEKKAVVFNANIGSNVLDVRPIEEVAGTSLPAVDLSWGSFPCQDLSLAGDMNGLYASRSGLFWQWLRVMDEMPERPPIVVAENVIGLVSAEEGKYYIAVHEELSNRGYNVGAVVLDAVHWVPQSRKRIFVIGVKKSIDISAFIGSGPGWCHPTPVVNVARKVRNWIWWSLPQPPERVVDITDIIEFDAPCDDAEERDAKLNLVPPEKLDFITSEAKRSRRVFTGYRRTRNHRQVLEVRTDGIAGCLRTPCGGSSRQVVFIVDGGKVETRLLTVREAARLMGAPDSFKIPGSYNDGYMAMGDGVAFPVVKFLSEQLLAPMARLAQ